MYKRTTPSDIIHALSLPTTPIKHAEDALDGVLQIFEHYSSGLGDYWMFELVGIAVAVYRYVSYCLLGHGDII